MRAFPDRREPARTLHKKDNVMAEGTLSADTSGGELIETYEKLDDRTQSLARGANSFATAMTRAFSTSVAGGKQLDDVLKTLALRLSDLSLRLALQPLSRSLVSNFNQLFASFVAAGSGNTGANLTAAMGAIKVSITVSKLSGVEGGSSAPPSSRTHLRASTAASSSNRSQSFIPSMSTAFGNFSSSTSSRNFDRLMSMYSAARRRK
jgi:hypothetical protein